MDGRFRIGSAAHCIEDRPAFKIVGDERHSPPDCACHQSERPNPFLFSSFLDDQVAETNQPSQTTLPGE
jgi:hypothetical protein